MGGWGVVELIIDSRFTGLVVDLGSPRILKVTYGLPRRARFA